MGSSHSGQKERAGSWMEPCISGSKIRRQEQENEKMIKLTEHGVVLAADGTFAAAEDALQKAEGKAKI